MHARIINLVFSSVSITKESGDADKLNMHILLVSGVHRLLIKFNSGSRSTF